MRFHSDPPTMLEAPRAGARRRRSDFIAILEAAYAPEPDPGAWLGEVVKAASPVLDYGLGCVAFSFRFTSRKMNVLHPIHLNAPAGTHERFGEAVKIGSGAEFTAAFLGAPSLLVSRAMPTLLDHPQVKELLRPIGLADQVAIVGHNLNGTGTALCGMLPKRGGFPRRSLKLLELVAAHLAAAQRLRARPSSDVWSGVEAVLSPAGAVLHAEKDARELSARESIVRAGNGMERARGKLRRSDPEEALALWRALVEGRWSLVETIDTDGKRFLLARKNPAGLKGTGLSLIEQQVAGYAALGHSSKFISYEVGIAASTVTKHMQSALAKLGLSSRAELIQVLTGKRP